MTVGAMKKVLSGRDTGRLDLKSKLRNRLPVFSAWTSLAQPSITEIFSEARFDVIGIDIEHSTTSLEQSQRIIATAQAAGVACLPRVASHNGEQIKRLLDSGADGVIVPMVNSLKEVEQIVRWVKYTPIGNRSYGVSRAHHYGFEFDRYVSGWNDRSVILIQIESMEAVRAVEDMVSHDQVDGAMIGPYDLSGSLGIPGQLDDPRVTRACKSVVEACRKAGKACGTQIVDPDEASVQKAFDAGYTFIVLSSDVFLLWKWSERMKNIIKNAVGV